ncbi:3-hydroxybutyrate oligomer hydrolase family protein [Caldimonas tepidiphila]|uniref:3-hydroxybutyrate oligomer hydrolase family protein n=1 Tax=Caldimonas tepidiphila TaxID=2315841 RepID=UPI000E5BCFA8|nr:3-hydroxybutyrate oligomer hydrolase family protein [Caldimonas tepidiphila]
METNFEPRARLRNIPRAVAALGALLALAAQGAAEARPAGLPEGVHQVRKSAYDGTSDDLLTAGLGHSGLASPLAPPVSDPPTAAELRRLAIYTNYRALVDMTPAGGYGSFYGPAVDLQERPTGGEGRIAGVEYLAYAKGTSWQNATLMVQIPAHFDPQRPCIVTATSSGSRGVYGAISTGEWGLKRGCAVAYTDKGTGGAPHDLSKDTVPLIDGLRVGAGDADKESVAFEARLNAQQLAKFNAATPQHFAFKHAHSQRNPEKDWGRFTLKAVEFAFWALDDHFGRPAGVAQPSFRPANTLVIASSLSNGGGAALAAAELDTGGLIDGVAVSEPSVQPPASPAVTVLRGGRPVARSGLPLYDYMSWANLMQPCAVLAPELSQAPGLSFVIAAFAVNRCAALKAAGLVSGDTPAAQAASALERLLEHGWEPEAGPLHASHAAFEVASAVTVTYANAYSRASVTERLCGFGFAATGTGGAIVPLAPASLASMFATGNGVPPSAGVQLVNENAPGGPRRSLLSASASTGQADFNTDGALCLRALLTADTPRAQALRTGIDETRRSGRLHGKPALIVHGRADALLPVNHTSRPYAALNRAVEGDASRLSYIEVTNAQHFDGFIGLPALLPGLDTRFVPLHVYLNRALDAMYAHLSEGRPLPPSQVLRTLPRSGTPGAALPLTSANLPPFAAQPTAADRIRIEPGRIDVPN